MACRPFSTSDLVGDKVQKEVLGVLNGGAILAGWNKTMIVLIPKVTNPERIAFATLSSRLSPR
jgi:hypothetical protein